MSKGKTRTSPGPDDSKQCWQCQLIISPELGENMLPEQGGHCACKGWTNDVFQDACELFRKKQEGRFSWKLDPIVRKEWDNLNKL